MSEWLVGMNVEYFGYKVPKDNFLSALEAQEEIFLINFEFDRQYFPLESIIALLSNIDVKINDFDSGDYCRIFLIDSNDFKKFCKYNLRLKDMDKVNLPHYIWLVEVYSNFELTSLLILDASAHKLDFMGSILAIWHGNQLNIYR